jgi:hypothetical protein
MGNAVPSATADQSALQRIEITAAVPGPGAGLNRRFKAAHRLAPR